jgi:hypothetical protein
MVRKRTNMHFYRRERRRKPESRFQNERCRGIVRSRDIRFQRETQPEIEIIASSIAE